MTKSLSWKELKFWNSGEWQVIEEKLDDLDRDRIRYCPSRGDMFASLDSVPFDKVKVVIMGQDPYPNPKHCTGVAFSVPVSVKEFPPTLKNIFKEYEDDLHYTYPSNGSLDKWCKEGVLLWNTTPSCRAFRSLSHQGWTEWSFLTQEIIEELSKRQQPVVFVFLGSKAAFYKTYVDEKKNYVITTSHPSPLGCRSGKNPFIGSRLFSTINSKLVTLKQPTVDWRLP